MLLPMRLVFASVPRSLAISDSIFERVAFRSRAAMRSVRLATNGAILKLLIMSPNAVRRKTRPWRKTRLR